MKRKIYLSLAKRFVNVVTILSIITCGNAFADNTKGAKNKETAMPSIHFNGSEPVKHADKKTPTSPAIYRELGNGWKISSLGGLVYENMDDPNYWFHLSGVIRADSTLFMGSYRDKQNDCPNGSNLRAVQVFMDGGLGCNFECTATLNFVNFANFLIGGQSVRAAHVASIDPDTWIAYEGFDNAEIFVGYLSGNWFGIDNSTGTTWMPFLERSLPALAFYPGDGLGMMADFWTDCSALTLMATQPAQGGTYFGGVTSGGIPATLPKATIRDHWRMIARATFAPVHEKGNVWHFGISGAWKESVTSIDGVPFADPINHFDARPSARARFTRPILNTQATLVPLANGTTRPLGPMIASGIQYFNVEIGRLCGPFLLEAEYTAATVRNVKNVPNSVNFFIPGNVNFHGYNVQARYMLTGESHSYDVRDGSFGSFTPCSPCGAVEIAARYDFINLNDKMIRGGTEHDVTLGINWFINQSVRLSANYIHASINPPNDNFKRNLDIIAFRAQVRFK